MRTVAWMALAGLALGSVWFAAPARADCATDRAADRAFAHPYGEPSPCPGEAASLEPEHVNVLADERGPRPLQTVGIAGMQGGAALAGIGGLSLLLSLLVPESNRSQPVLHWAGVGLAAAGGTTFLVGGTLTLVDALATPTPTPDRRGAQLTVSFRF